MESALITQTWYSNLEAQASGQKEHGSSL